MVGVKGVARSLGLVAIVTIMLVGGAAAGNPCYEDCFLHCARYTCIWVLDSAPCLAGCAAKCAMGDTCKDSSSVVQTTGKIGALCIFVLYPTPSIFPLSKSLRFFHSRRKRTNERQLFLQVGVCIFGLFNHSYHSPPRLYCWYVNLSFLSSCLLLYLLFHSKFLKQVNFGN